jgi:hypothetical protein
LYSCGVLSVMVLVVYRISKCVILCAAGLLQCLSMQWIFATLCNHKQLKGKRYLNLEIICLFGVGGYQ